MKLLNLVALASATIVPIGWITLARTSRADSAVASARSSPAESVAGPSSGAIDPGIAVTLECSCQGSSDGGDSETNANGTISVSATVEDGFCDSLCAEIHGCETFLEFSHDLVGCKSYTISSQTPPGNPLTKKLQQGSICREDTIHQTNFPRCDSTVRYIFNVSGFPIIYTDVTCAPCAE